MKKTTVFPLICGIADLLSGAALFGLLLYGWLAPAAFLGADLLSITFSAALCACLLGSFAAGRALIGTAFYSLEEQAQTQRLARIVTVTYFMDTILKVYQHKRAVYKKSESNKKRPLIFRGRFFYGIHTYLI